MYKTIGQLMLVTLVIVGITAYVERNRVATVFNAGNKEKEVSVLLYPNNMVKQPGAVFNLTPIVSSPTKPVGYISLAISFNRAEIEFKGLDDTLLNRHYEILLPPDPTAANSDGIIEVTYGVKDNDTSTTGPIELAKLNFTVKNADQNVITIDPNRSQIVFDTGSDDAEPADITVEEAKINFPQTDSPTPAVTGNPDTSPTQLPNISPTMPVNSNVIPTLLAPSPTRTEIPTLAPTTIATPVPTPMVTPEITSPAN